MKTYIYDVEVIDELTNTYMNFPFEYQIWDGDSEPLDDSDMDLCRAIMSGLSVVPQLVRIEE